MNKLRLLFALVILLLLGACQPTEDSSEAVEAVEVQEVEAAQETATATEFVPMAAADAGDATETPPSAPEATATNAPASPTPPATAMPSATPIPANPVNNIQLVPIASGFQSPLYVTHAGDERLFVLEQPGVVRIIQDGTVLETPFLDLRDRVRSTSLEQGLLGLAFDPEYQQNGAFYVHYSDLNGDTTISRFKVSDDDPNRALPDRETILLQREQPYPNHNGGQISFGPDGYLYIGLGDGGSANDPLNNGQDPSTLLGAVLRIDVDANGADYAIPPDNPFISNENAADEIWAWGLRNPWRFSFDRLTGDLYIADVGQNMWEEVNFEPAGSPGGLNYGWNILEGTHCFMADTCDREGLELPIFEYDHSLGCSVTGGYVYRGEAFPELNGNYFLADYCQGRFWRLFPAENGRWLADEILDTELVVSSFGEDVSGELYVTAYTEGAIYQIQPAD